MTVTEKFFIECLVSGIKNERVKDIYAGVDFERLYQLCRFHKMEVVVNKAIENIYDKFPEKFLSALDCSVKRQVYKSIQNQSSINLVLQEFEKNGIKSLPLKGYYLSKTYPFEEMRFATDCDILIDKKQIKDIEELVEKLGLKQIKSNAHHDVYVDDNTNTIFEFHKKVFIGKLEGCIGNGFENAHIEDGKKCLYRLKNEDFYISVIAHIAYHFSQCAGVGVRSLADVYLVRKNYNLNQEYVDLQLEKFGLLKFKNQFEKLVECVFEKGEFDEFSNMLIKYVISCSVLGNNEKKEALNVLDGGKVCLPNVKRRARLKLIFPSVENMKLYFPILKRCIILLPICYVVRWFKIILFKPSRLSKLKKIDGLSFHDVETVCKIFEGLGIKTRL